MAIPIDLQRSTQNDGTQGLCVGIKAIILGTSEVQVLLEGRFEVTVHSFGIFGWFERGFVLVGVGCCAWGRIKVLTRASSGFWVEVQALCVGDTVSSFKSVVNVGT